MGWRKWLGLEKPKTRPYYEIHKLTMQDGSTRYKVRKSWTHQWGHTLEWMTTIFTSFDSAEQTAETWLANELSRQTDTTRLIKTTEEA